MLDASLRGELDNFAQFGNQFQWRIVGHKGGRGRGIHRGEQPRGGYIIPTGTPRGQFPDFLVARVFGRYRGHHGGNRVDIDNCMMHVHRHGHSLRVLVVVRRECPGSIAIVRIPVRLCHLPAISDLRTSRSSFFSRLRLYFPCICCLQHIVTTTRP
jgi:hypothetical protein